MNSKAESTPHSSSKLSSKLKLPRRQVVQPGLATMQQSPILDCCGVPRGDHPKTGLGSSQVAPMPAGQVQGQERQVHDPEQPWGKACISVEIVTDPMHVRAELAARDAKYGTSLEYNPKKPKRSLISPVKKTIDATGQKFWMLSDSWNDARRFKPSQEKCPALLECQAEPTWTIPVAPQLKGKVFECPYSSSDSEESGHLNDHGSQHSVDSWDDFQL
jgi:hypothetical protein